MGGKLKHPLTPAQKWKRGAPLRKIEKRKIAAWVLIGAIVCGWLVVLFKDLGL